MTNSYIGCIPGNCEHTNWVLDMAGRHYSELELMVAELKNLGASKVALITPYMDAQLYGHVFDGRIRPIAQAYDIPIALLLSDTTNSGELPFLAAAHQVIREFKGRRFKTTEEAPLELKGPLLITDVYRPFNLGKDVSGPMNLDPSCFSDGATISASLEMTNQGLMGRPNPVAFCTDTGNQNRRITRDILLTGSMAHINNWHDWYEIRDEMALKHGIKEGVNLPLS